MEIAEFEASLARRPALLARVFTPGELAYCRARPRAVEHLAARFAAKEAAFKAAGTGWANGTSWRSIEVVSVEGERPRLRIRGALRERLGDRTVRSSLSLSHSGSYAIAAVLLWSEPT